MQKLTLNHQDYPLEWLIHTPNKILWDTLPLYDKNILQFCRRWLTGEQSFTIYTSGSTGAPKEITLTRQQMTASAQLTGRALNLQTGDAALVCLFAEFIAGMMMLVRGFVLNLELVIINPAGNPLTQFPLNTHFDFTALVPLQLQHILTDTPEKIPILNRMKAIIVGGAPISAALHRQIQRLTAPVYHTYGMTETVTHIALKRLNGPYAGKYFVPLPGVNLSQDERGCLTITSALTNEQTVVTNDLVELQSNGSFKWLGRIDNVINSGGVKIQVEKVETALETALLTLKNGHYAQRRFFIGPLAHHRLGQTVTAIIEGNPLSLEEETEIRKIMRNSLTKYEIPRQFCYLPTLRGTPTGKIDRTANLRQLAQRSNAHFPTL